MVLVLKDMLGQLIFRRRLGSLVKIVAKLKAAIAAMQIDSYTQCFIDGDLALPANGSL
jgi:hypothetical protein